MSPFSHTAISSGWNDCRAALRKHHLFTTFGWQDVATRYRRSRVGAFWITISMAIMIGTLGFVFGTLFNQPMREFLPYLTIGLIIWGFLSTAINEGCTGFVVAEGIILQVRIPFFTHIMRIIWRNTIILGHNLLILPVVFLIFLKPVSLNALLAIPGFLLLVFNVGWMMLMLAVVCARYRDLTQIMQNLLQVFFYLTPIIWSAALMPKRVGTAILDLNPFYHLMSIVRAPLLGEAPSLMNWTFSGVMLLVGWSIALAFFGHYHKRIPYWL